MCELTPMGEQNWGYDQGMGTEIFGQFIFSEMPIYDRLHVLSLKHVGDEGQLRLSWDRFEGTWGPMGPDW